MIIFKKFSMLFLITSFVFFTQCNNGHECELAGKRYKEYTDIDPNLIVGQVVSNDWDYSYGVFSGGFKDNNLRYIFFRYTENFGTEDQTSIILDTLIVDMTQYAKNMILSFVYCSYKNYQVVAIYDRYSRSSVRTIAKAWAADTKKKRFVELDPDSVTCMSEYELYGDEP